MPERATTPFGQQLKHWRRLRGTSQLELAIAADVSPRHLSFLESGRSRPSTAIVLRLCDGLDVPLRERNALLAAAGLPPAYPHTRLDDEMLEPFRRVIDRMLRTHEPFPALVLDRSWNVVDGNTMGRRLFAAAFVEARANLVDLLLEPGPWRELLDNWAEVACAIRDRLRREVAHAGPDPGLARLLARAESHTQHLASRAGSELGALVLWPRLRIGDRCIRTITTVAHFNTPRDVTLDELRVELIYPADDEAEAWFRSLAEG